MSTDNSPGNMYAILPIDSAPGIQRDGTAYKSDSFIDGQYIRFYQGTPKKIGGCELMEFGDEKIVTKMYGYERDDTLTVFLGKTNSVKYFNVDRNNFIPNTVIDITPDISPDYNWNPDAPDNMWTFDVYSYTVETEEGLASSSFLYAQVCQSRTDMSTTNVGPVFYTNADEPSKLLPVFAKTGPLPENRIPVQVSGGIIFYNNLIVAYGSNGAIYWSDSNAPPEQDWHMYSGTMPDDSYPANQAIIANTKIVHAELDRGGVVFWALDSLIRSNLEVISYTIGEDTFTYPTFTKEIVQSKISILAPNSVVNYNQMIFWMGVDQFYVYNGIVQNHPNKTNNDWFFDNVNTKAAAKIWATTVPRYGEIWWFYPRLPYTPSETGSMSDQECNAVIIYNIFENIWYDLTIPPNSPQDGIFPWKRSAGLNPTSIIPNPIWADNSNVKITYAIGERIGKPIWIHESGYDYVLTEIERYSIPAYFTTRMINLWKQNPNFSYYLQTWRVIPDFIQNGTMSVIINTQDYPNSVIINSEPQVFSKDPEDVNYKTYLDFEIQSPIVTFSFASNTLGGMFHMGMPEYYFSKGDPLK